MKEQALVATKAGFLIFLISQILEISGTTKRVNRLRGSSQCLEIFRIFSQAGKKNLLGRLVERTW